MSTIVTLRDAIKSKLETVIQGDGTSTISIVYTYAESKPEGYPYAYILYKGDNSETLSNTYDRVIYTFEITLVQEKIEELKGRANAEATAMNMAEAIAEAFRADNNLSTAGVLKTRPIKTEKIYVDNSTRIALKILLEIETIEQIIY